MHHPIHIAACAYGGAASKSQSCFDNKTQHPERLDMRCEQQSACLLAGERCGGVRCSQRSAELGAVSDCSSWLLSAHNRSPSAHIGVNVRRTPCNFSVDLNAPQITYLRRLRLLQGPQIAKQERVCDGLEDVYGAQTGCWRDLCLSPAW